MLLVHPIKIPIVSINLDREDIAKLKGLTNHQPKKVKPVKLQIKKHGKELKRLLEFPMLSVRF